MSQEQLRKKMLDFAKSYEYSNLITIDAEGFPKGRMMENIPVDDTLTFFFATFANSDKVTEITQNNRASIFLYRPSDHNSMSVQGIAEIVTDDAVRKEKWKEKWTVFWKEGPSDPLYTLIKITPKKITLLDFATLNQEVVEL